MGSLEADDTRWLSLDTWIKGHVARGAMTLISEAQWIIFMAHDRKGNASVAMVGLSGVGGDQFLGLGVGQGERVQWQTGCRLCLGDNCMKKDGAKPHLSGTAGKKEMKSSMMPLKSQREFQKCQAKGGGVLKSIVSLFT